MLPASVDLHGNQILFFFVAGKRTTFYLKTWPKLTFFSSQQKLSEEEFPTKATSSHGDLQYVSRGMMLLRKEDSGLAAQARSILAWNNRYIS